jgi:hypothetical protein
VAMFTSDHERRMYCRIEALIGIVPLDVEIGGAALLTLSR